MTTIASGRLMKGPPMPPPPAKHGERGHREHRGESGHEDRPQAVAAAFDHGVVEIQSTASVLLDEVEKNDRLGDHDSGQHQDSNEARQRQRRVRDEERDDRPGRRRISIPADYR